MIERICRWGWNRLPLSLARKRQIRDALFRRFPGWFRAFPAFQRWLLIQEDIQAALDQRQGGAEGGSGDRLQPEDAATVRIIAMHLPQFHRIPENDRWWGAGFTEWTNVRRGRPMYHGHYQPHVPHADIGYYDLEHAGVLERQAEMARSHGVHGFCFYHYWFNGRRLLEMPVERFLASGRPDFPFCICWANENWTRTWDGLDQEVLIDQRHDPESDRRFIEDVLPFLRDRRYIRIDGRPLLLVYRADLLSEPAAVSAAWRARCEEAGIGDIHLCSVWSHARHDPRLLGFDSALQFPPLVIGGENLALDASLGLESTADFRGAILDYHVAASQCTAPLSADYPVFRGVMPSWDNTARRMQRGTSWLGASPRAYGRWLRAALRLACHEHPPDHRLVFVNAWNEWAEGAHLEPDERHGYAFLEETASAAIGAEPPVGRTWLEAGSPEMTRRLAQPGRHILVDLLFCQPGFHGGGEYGKAVFAALVAEALRNRAICPWAAFDPGTFMEPWVWEVCADNGVPVIAVRSPDEMMSLVAKGLFATFFTPGLVAHAETIAARDDPASPRATRVIGTVHDVREVTLAAELPALDAMHGAPRVRISQEAYARLFDSPWVDTIVTVSEHSRREILRCFGTPRASLVVLAPPAKREVAARSFLICGHDDPAAIRYALLVNAGRPEKNARIAVQAFDDLFSRTEHAAVLDGLRVVVAGIDTLDDIGIQGLRHPWRFIACPACAPAHYEFLLACMEFLVYPSLDEGFGYPPVEAMRHGRPTVAADAGAMREACGDAAVYFDPRSAADIGRAILRMAEDPISRPRLRERHQIIAGHQQRDLARLVSLIGQR